MSGVASVVEIWNGRTSGESEKAVRTYRRVWRVTTFHVLARGQNGTTVAAHAVNAPVKMLPYYLPFTGYKVLPFAALNLP